MSPHQLEIAIEHHRAGRVRQAQEGYRALLAEDPNHADAAYWLGVIAVQAQQPAEALPLLLRAVAARPDDAAYHHALGQAYLDLAQPRDAVASLRKAAALAPDTAQTHLMLGLALLARRDASDPASAVAAFTQARAAGLESPEVHHHLGVALLATDQPDTAIDELKIAIQKRPEYASAYHYLGIALRAKGDPRGARRALLKGLELEPMHAQSWYALAMLDAEAGNFDIAANLFRRAVQAKADFAGAYQALGQVLERSGKREEAMGAYRQAVRATRGELTQKRPPTNLADAVDALEKKVNGKAVLELHHALASHADIFAPAQLPATRVTDLFDKYADRFDKHLRESLHYGVPEMIAEAIAMIHPAKPLDILDLGCGTGLCGPLLKPFAETLWGVDLSPAMIEKARERGVYDELHVGDLVAALRAAPPASFDVLAAADVMVYVGDLSPVFEAAARTLRADGRLIFSVEAGGGDRYILHKKTLRYTHAEAYVRHVATLFAYEIETFRPIVVRTESGKPVGGYLVVLKAPAEA